jgi:hypothetical protein
MVKLPTKIIHWFSIGTELSALMDSRVSRVAQYSGWLQTGRQVQSWTESEDFSSNPLHPIGCGAHPASCTMSIRGSSHGGKVWPGHDADHLPPSSAKVKKDGLYFLNPQVPFMACSGSTLLLCNVDLTQIIHSSR